MYFGTLFIFGDKMTYSEQQFGFYISDNYVTIEIGYSIKQAMRSLLAQAADKNEIDMLFAVDEGRYVGVIALKTLILAREGTPLSSLIRTDQPFVLAHHMVDENVTALHRDGVLPVLSEQGHLCGVIRTEGLLEILGEEFGEDYARLGGLTEEEERQEPLGKSLKKRLPWLSVLLLLGLGVSTVIGAFEGIFGSLTEVVCFQSLILGMAGNSGTQSLAVTVRLLSEGSLKFKEKVGLFLKEIRVGVTGGLMLGVLSWVSVTVYSVLVQGMNFAFAIALGGCVGLSMWLAMTLSAAAGTLIPLLFEGLGFDPAVASGPLITTLNDLSAVVIYYGLTWLIFIQIR